MTSREIDRPVAALRMDVNASTGRWTTRFRAIAFALVAISLLVAAVLPVCGGICCPAGDDAASMHAQMPCCAGEASVAREESPRLPKAAGVSPAPRIWVPVAIVARAGATCITAPRVQAVRDHDAISRHEPSPPLFLLNAQFLI